MIKSFLKWVNIMSVCVGCLCACHYVDNYYNSIYKCECLGKLADDNDILNTKKILINKMRFKDTGKKEFKLYYFIYFND